MRNQRSGLTLVEVIVAMLVFSTGALGLAATSAVITRQMTTSLSRSRSAAFARERSETAHSMSCGGISGGEETRDGIRASWTVVQGDLVTLDQQLERSTRTSTVTDRFLSAVPCN